MDTRVVKSYLKQIGKADAHINSLLLELDKMAALATRITATMKDEVVSGALPSDKSDAILRIFELNERINQRIDHYVDLKNEVSDMVEKLEDKDHITVIYAHYFHGKKWPQIAEEIHCSERWAQKLHGKALLAFGEIMKQEGKL